MQDGGDRRGSSHDVESFESASASGAGPRGSNGSFSEAGGGADAQSALLAVVRNQDLVGLLGLVQSIAREVHRRLGGRIDLDDLVGEGYLALVRCRDRFDPATGATFATFAYRRIEGSMLDLARRRFRMSESRYLAGGYLEAVGDVLDATSSDAEWDGRGPSSDARFAARAVGRTAMASLIRRSGGGSAEAGDDEVRGGELRELKELLQDALGRLGEQDQLVLRRLWLEGRSLGQLGAELGVSKEYARRLNLRALDRIRRLMSAAPMA